MSPKTVAEAIVAQLASWEVEYVFGVCGSDVLPFLDAMKANGKIKYIAAAHEAGAAYMATYYAKLTGGLGVCLASAAGAVNLLEGVADAHLNGLPVLALTGQVARSKIGTPVKQYFRQNALYDCFTGYTETVADEASALKLLIRAMSRALLGRKAAHLALPEDIWLKTTQWETASKPALLGQQMRGRYLKGDVEKAKGLMLASKYPLVVIGEKGKQVRDEIISLAERWGAAVVLTQECKGLIPDKWHRVIGGVGEGWLPNQLSEVDCVLMIGTASFEEQFLPQVPVIQIEEEARQIKDPYLWNSLAGNLVHIIETLGNDLTEYHINPVWQKKINETKNARLKMMEADSDNHGIPIHPAKLMADLGEVAAGDAVIAVDIGAFMHWFDRSFQAREQTILISSFWRSMGAALPAATAAQLKLPNRQVVALVGDGGLLMSLGEFAVAVRYKLPITVVVVRNHTYGLERDRAGVKGLKPSGLNVPGVEFGQFAVSCGGKGYKVDDPADLRGALSRALSQSEPTLVDVVCDSVRLPFA